MKSIKVISVVLAVIIIVIGFNIISKTDTYKKYKLTTMAKIQGAEYITVEDDSVTFLLGKRYITYYSFDYGIKELSGK